MIKFVKCKATLFMMAILAVISGHALYAQTYFAGAGAGAGNTGTLVTGVGTFALGLSNSGTANAAFGSNALFNNSFGNYNSAFGANSLYRNTTGAYNTAVGKSTLYNNISGMCNTAVGAEALTKSNSVSNTAVGAYALNLNTSGNFNTSVGKGGLSSNTIGYENTSIGYATLENNINGYRNSALGAYALQKNTGAANTAVGVYALQNNLGGSSHTAIGHLALTNLSGGFDNVGIGNEAGSNFNAYNSCTFIGTSADATLTGRINATAIGNHAKVDASNKVVIGNTLVTSIGGTVGWTTYTNFNRQLKSDAGKSKLGLDFIMALNPVTYRTDTQNDIEYTGLIAEEVDAAAKKSGVAFSGIDKSGDTWGIRYAELTVPLIKAVQESAAENLELKNRIEKLEAFVQKIQQNNTRIFIENKNSTSILFQNQPNPFSQSTVIQYNLAATTQNAHIIIRNINGSIVKQVALQQTGKGNITITAGELAAGTYTYSLLINDVVADTRLMVITR